MSVPFMIGNQRMKRLREALGGRALSDDVAGHESCDGLVRHPLHDLVDERQSVRPIVSRPAMGQELQHHLRRDTCQRGCHVAQDRLQLLLVGFLRALGDGAQHADQRRSPGRNPAAGGGALIDRRDERRQPLRVAGDFGQRSDGVFTQRERVAREAAGEDLLPRGRLTARALAQDFGVVDFPQFHVSSRHRRPQTADAAVGANRFWRAAEQLQHTAPGVKVAAGMDRDLADEMIVQKAGELADGLIDPQRHSAAEPHRIRQHRDLQRFGEMLRGRQVDDAGERRGDGRVRRRIQGDGPRSSSARTGELVQARRLVGGERRGLGHRSG